jgi:hypothetical protein
MLSPYRGSDESRQRDLEQQRAAEREQRVLPDFRSAAAAVPRFAIHRAIALDEITRGTFGTVKIAYWNGSAYVDSGQTVECGGYLLNSGQTILVDQAIFIVHLPDNTWEVLNGNCSIRDWLLDGES